MPTHLRKHPRLKEYDYSQNGCYFVTVCTKNRRPILGEISVWNHSENSSDFTRPCIVDGSGSFLPLDANGDAASVGVDAHIDPQIRLSYSGRIVERYLRTIPGICAYAIMPNHVHLMIAIFDGRPCNGPMWASAPTTAGNGSVKASPHTNGGAPHPSQPLGARIRSFKTLTSKTVGLSLWQRSYYDHVIRSEAEALRILQYIQTNPVRWTDDEYYQT